MNPASTRRVAVVGSGVSGLVAGYVLARDAHVTLFEADDRLGGHADTQVVETSTGTTTLPIDTGFIVHNRRTYPTLVRLFEELGVPTQPSDMSMSVRDHASGLEYAGALGARGLFPTGRNLARPGYLRMLVEITRFHRRARAVLADDGDDTTLAAFLEDGHFSAYFRRHFATPLVACVWSCDPEVALEYPARYLFGFLEHHGMLTVFGSPSWRTVTGGSREYVERVAAHLHDIRLGTKVVDVALTASGVRITDGSGAGSDFDAVVIATHPDQALAMLAEPTPEHREILSAMTYSDNVAQLHTDTSLLPVSDHARASWNYQRRTADDGHVLVTYDLTRLMRLPSPDGTRYLVTLNGADIIKPETVISTREYSHPIYDPASVAAQERLPSLNTDRIAFAGAYHGWGFHEDGALSGLRAAEHLGGSWPATATAGPPPTPSLYDVKIAHARTKPLRNIFRQRSYSWLVDLDDLPRYGPLARFVARDHIGNPDASLRANIESLLIEHGVVLDQPRILMLAQARVLGYGFNPISVFWCYDGPERDRVAAVVVEVHNTYGGRHAYVVHPDARGHARIEKQLYVSPFNDTSGHYDVEVPSPGERAHISVTLHRPDTAPFVATLNGVRRPATRRAVLATSLRMPAQPLANAARIRIQGVKLWLRRLPVQPRPHSTGAQGGQS